MFHKSLLLSNVPGERNYKKYKRKKERKNHLYEMLIIDKHANITFKQSNMNENVHVNDSINKTFNKFSLTKKLATKSARSN